MSTDSPPRHHSTSIIDHTYQEAYIMARKYIDCREFPSESNCSVAMSADSDKELMEAAVQHAVTVHQHEDTPELREQLQQLFKEGTPPVEHPTSMHQGEQTSAAGSLRH
jgi:predicted small metal-binding protein